jgi:hypothetical protein
MCFELYENSEYEIWMKWIHVEPDGYSRTDRETKQSKVDVYFKMTYDRYVHIFTSWSNGAIQFPFCQMLVPPGLFWNPP